MILFYLMDNKKYIISFVSRKFFLFNFLYIKDNNNL